MNSELIVDFSTLKPCMMIAFAAIGVGSGIYVHDFCAVLFLAVLGIAVVFSLLTK
jgi:hypothetical protein